VPWLTTQSLSSLTDCKHNIYRHRRLRQAIILATLKMPHMNISWNAKIKTNHLVYLLANTDVHRRRKTEMNQESSRWGYRATQKWVETGDVSAWSGRLLQRLGALLSLQWISPGISANQITTVLNFRIQKRLTPLPVARLNYQAIAFNHTRLFESCVRAFRLIIGIKITWSEQKHQ